jgi:hypothetical protein
MADTISSGLAARAPVMATHSLDDAIVLLEAGQGAGLIVDLGHGRLARASGMRGDEGLLQRLRGHKLILALASGQADLSHFSGSARPLVIAPEVQDIIDAIVSRG